MIKKDICANAGIIRQLLSEQKTLLISEIQTKTKLSSENILYALGWLAREDNVVFFEKDNSMSIMLTNNFSEMYF